jgi:enoyl-CoA hydratase/carnithine racemase
MTTTTPSALSVSTQAGVRTITLNRPDVRNAFNDEVISELKTAFRGIGRNRPRVLRRCRSELDAPHGRLHARRKLG